MSDLPERLRALADAIQGLEWELPVTAREDCLRAAEEIERLQAENTRLKSQWLSDADLDKIARRMAEVAMDKIGEAYNASMCATTAYLLGDTAARAAGGKDE